MSPMISLSTDFYSYKSPTIIILFQSRCSCSWASYHSDWDGVDWCEGLYKWCQWRIHNDPWWWLVWSHGEWRRSCNVTVWPQSIFPPQVRFQLPKLKCKMSKIWNLYCRLSLYVPWNEVLVLSPVQLSNEEVHLQIPELYQAIDLCEAHDYDTMQPIALSGWMTNYQGADPVSYTHLTLPTKA